MNKLFSKKNVLLLFMCGWMGAQLYAQQTPKSMFNSKRAQNNFSPESGKLFAKLGILNLMHPTAPSVDLGVEYMLTEKFSLELVYGLKCIRGFVGGFRERIYFDNYYKLFGGVRFYPNGRGTDARGMGKRWPNFVALEGYYSRGNTWAGRNFALDNLNHSRLDYYSALVNKQAKSLNVKSGYIWNLMEKLSLETSFGLGIIFYQRDYTFDSPEINEIDFEADVIGPYDDRNIGRTQALHIIANLKLNYRIF